MDVKDIISSWKSIITGIVFIVGLTISYLAYSENLVEQKIILVKAQAALIHNDYYQNGRIDRKQIIINEHKRELSNLLEDVGDDEPTPRQAREIKYLDMEILRLRLDIESIREQLNEIHE